MIYETYKQAREAFLQAARDRSARQAEFVLPGAKGREGETLAMDVAVLGDESAPKALLVVTGEHGLEGLPGSAAQLELLLREPAPPKDTKIVLVHAINPWGVSHGSRTTEENVDVNRNFVDFSVPYVRNVAYDAVFPVYCPEYWTDDAPEMCSRATQAIQEEHGAAFLLDGMTAGQRHEPTGTNYGGLAPTWNRLTLEQIVSEYLGQCEKVAFVDWHTGFGAYTELFHLCKHPEGSEALKRVGSWWGDEAVTRNSAAFQGAGGAVPKWTGMFSMALPELLPKAAVAGSVIEFGTFPNVEVRTSIMIDRFLRFGRENRSSQSEADMRTRMLAGFAPQDEVWRAAILERSLEAHRQALSGLAIW